MSARRVVDLLLAGTCWGVVAALLGRRAFGTSIMAGVLAAPLIGLGVGATMQPLFERLSGWRRNLVALGSVYLGATAFGVAIGVAASLGLFGGARRFPEVLMEPVLGVWWGVTLAGSWIVLWPLAYLTHRLLEWRGER